MPTPGPHADAGREVTPVTAVEINGHAVRLTAGRRRRWLSLALWLVLCVGGGALIGAAVGSGNSPWYTALTTPPWTPPSWLFAPVWTTLYALMAIAAWLVWRRGGWRRQREPLAWFLAQLAANFAWSPLFFGLRAPALALADLVLLWFLAVETLFRFGAVRPVTGWLLAPYIAWLTFAGALNAWIVWMN